MANFQESRFFGLSPRAVWLTLAVAGVVVGLFFMPPALKYLFEGSGKQKPKAGPSAAVAAKQPVEQKASLNADKLQNTEKLQQVTTELAAVEQKASTKTQPKKADAADPQKDQKDSGSSGGGLFSGLNFQVKARTNADGLGTGIPAGVTFDKIQSKDAQAFFKAGAGDIRRFIKRQKVPAGTQVDAMLFFSDALAELGGGVKGVSNDQIWTRLGALHAQTLRQLSAGGADRGMLMAWLSIPVVAFVDDGSGVHALQKIRSIFAPRMSLVSAAVRERAPAAWGLGQSALANANLQFVVHSSDVSMVRVMNNGQIVREFKLGRADANGDRFVRVSGDASGVWTLLAFDKYGARPYSKSYAFYPRVQAFPQNQTGLYEIAFEPGSARNSLDKFFFIGSSGGGRKTSDPMIAQF